MINKKKKILISPASIVILIGIVMCSPGLMLRIAVFPYSPASSFTMKYEEEKSELKGVKVFRITENAPVENGTEGELTTWAVYNIGPFHFAKYYGEA